MRFLGIGPAWCPEPPRDLVNSLVAREAERPAAAGIGGLRAPAPCIPLPISLKASTKLRPHQVACLEAIFSGKYVVFPWHGHLLPSPH